MPRLTKKMMGASPRGPKTKRKLKNKGKFPDLSGDGKVTKKDILMGRGVIKKKTMKKKKKKKKK